MCRLLLLIACLFTGLFVNGCRSAPVTYEAAARDWCMTIRASQVVPVYPLTEDVQPGDVFAVQTPLSRQHEIFEARGFLALDQHVVRLPTTHSAESMEPGKAPGNAAATRTLPYDSFYRHGYWTQAWTAAVPRPGWGDADAVKAPRAAFPSYTFDVHRGQGLRLAIPVSGVPLGLGLMRAQRATGTVTLRDAYTYGMDIETLYKELRAWWASDPEIRRTLAAVSKQSSAEVYLRAVNRVYMVRGVTVSIQNLDSRGAGLDAGTTAELDLLHQAIESPNEAAAAVQSYEAVRRVLSSLNTVSGSGGSLHIAHASSHLVTMNETFDRPLVIGYLGFDVRVESDGSLSVPVPSFALLSREADIPFVDTTEEIDRFEMLWGVIGKRPRAEQDVILKRVVRRVGGAFRAEFEKQAGENQPARIAFLHAKNTFTDAPSIRLSSRKLARVVEAIETELYVMGED